MKIGLLGGSFNPIHIGHIRLSLESIEIFQLDELLLIPNFVSPFKNSNLDFNYRIKMLEFISNKYRKIDIFRFEISKNKPSYTIFTLEELKRIYPLDMLIWIIGDDAFAELYKWKRWEDLFLYCNFAVFKRNSVDYPYIISDIIEKCRIEDFNQNYGQIVEVNDWNQINLSSSQIRNRIANKLNCDYLLDKEILKFILDEKLYLN